MDDANAWKRANRKRKNDELTADELADRQARKQIKMEVDTEFDDGVEVVDENIQEIPKKHKKKKKNNEEDVKEELVEVDDTEVKVEEGDQDARSKTRNRTFSNAKFLTLMSFDECKKMRKENPKCGIQILQEKRHIALSYHLLGGSVQKGIDYVVHMTVGKYRKSVKGVVIAIQSCKLIRNPRVVDDQNVFHCDVLVTQAVFRPAANQVYECVVKHISNDYISALVLGVISINMPMNKQFDENLRGLELNVGDTVSAKYTGITINRGLCSLRGQFVKILKKAVKAEVQEDEEEGSPTKKANVTRFNDTDEEIEDD